MKGFLTIDDKNVYQEEALIYGFGQQLWLTIQNKFV